MDTICAFHAHDGPSAQLSPQHIRFKAERRAPHLCRGLLRGSFTPTAMMKVEVPALPRLMSLTEAGTTMPTAISTRLATSGSGSEHSLQLQRALGEIKECGSGGDHGHVEACRFGLWPCGRPA